MNLAEIKAAIPKLTPQEQQRDAIRQLHFNELKRKLEKSYADVAAGRVHEWTDATIDE